ncbi:hypothetical protein A6A04_07985 [Paramagnetospirillum marisnigri]|uniref:histidine kinase n=1 Tax=Paramagnetospirillum marisnigri TaxID=1285242 RepID=A0A178M7L1_9PROT|nr:ATP-binding protein [Paramagnetospirillum marisnigri]OAN44749.1 hypothetical protein A6A04_07985 [Paramagnetospirillum marisnigri]
MTRIGTIGQGIGWRLLLAIVLFSSFVTLSLTALQLYLDYRSEIQDIRDRLSEIGKSYLGGLGGSLWSLDEEQIQLQIEGIKHLPDIQYVEVREVGRPHKRQLARSVGVRATEQVISHDFPVHYAPSRDRNDLLTIGVLHVEASLLGVYGRIADRAAAILISQGVKTFLVSAFILFIVHRLVTRHLVSISAFLRNYRLGAPVRPVELTRTPPNPPDELDDMTSAINSMSASLADSLGEREAALRRLRQQEAALDRAYRHFSTLETAAKLAHEIKQPLACVSTYVQGVQAQLRTGSLDQQELPGLMDRIGREVQRVRDIISTSQSRVAASGGENESLFLGDVLRDVLPLVRQTCDDAVVAAWLDVASPGPVVLGNRTSLQQVVVNLVRNACEAMADLPRHRRRLRLLLIDEPGPRISFTVQDSGLGFPRDIIQTGHALFSSSKPVGSGFGLPIAAAIMAAHGGGLEIANDENGGGRVTCWLPRLEKRRE